MQGRRILVTGAGGQLAFPVAAALAEENEVWGVARFARASGRDRLEAAGVRTAAVDLADPDWDELPGRFDHLLHFAADITGDDFDRALRTNAEGTGLLMTRWREAASLLVVSSTVVYDLHDDPAHRFAENDALGDSKPLFGRTYPISKIAQEATARAFCRALGVPTTIARMNLSYGANGGLPAYQLDAIRLGEPVAVATHETFHNPFFEADIVASIPALLDVASVPATITNWAGPETVSMREYCRYLATLLDREPVFEEVEGFMRSRAVDTARQEALIGPAVTGWRDGMRRLVAERLPPDQDNGQNQE